MASDAQVREALMAAAAVLRRRFDWGGPDEDMFDEAAAAVEAFLRTWSDTAPPTVMMGYMPQDVADSLADAVARAAEGDG